MRDSSTASAPALLLTLVRGALLLCLLVAFGVRAYHLDFQSFWSDEGISLLRSALPLPELLASMPVEHLPGYFVLLHFWIPLAGQADFALRFFALWPSVLTVAVSYRLATDLADRTTGLVAAALLATNAFQVWYGQELRTYSWLLATSLLATWFFWRMLSRPKEQPVLYWVGYVSAMTLTVYQHYYGFLTPLAHTLFAIGWTLYARDWRFLWRWASAGVITLLCFLPWLPRALQIFGFSGWRDPIDPWQIPWRVLTVYTVSDTMTSVWREWIIWLYLALIVAGLVTWAVRRGRAFFFLGVTVGAPLAIVLGLALRNPDFHERYTISISALLLICVAGAITFLPRLARGSGGGQRILRLLLSSFATLLIGVLLAGNLQALQQLYTNTSFHKPDFRGAARMIEAWGEPGDVVLVDGPDPNIVFLHYYGADYPVQDLRFLLTAKSEEVDATLQVLTADAKRVWEVLYFHEPFRVQAWLAQHGWTSPPTDYNGIRLDLYGMADPTLATYPLGIPFGNALVLTAAELPGSPLLPGQLARVSTHWQVVAPPPDYKFSLRLQQVNGEMVQAQDYVPLNWFAPTPSWPVGGEMVERRSFVLPKDLPQGDYQVTLRLYEPATGAVAETPNGQDVLLGVFTVGE
ncbi:MAG: glycosyltransferase family 39 protein [Caldilineaceae bacterium]